MEEQPVWAANVQVDDLVSLIDATFKRKYGRPMTKRGRKELRRVLNEEVLAIDDETRFETGIESLQHAAERFAELTAGDLKLSGKTDSKHDPRDKSLDGYGKVGVAAVNKAVQKARSYHRVNGNLCPVWPF